MWCASPQGCQEQVHSCLQLTARRNRWALLMAQLHSLLPSRQEQAQPWKYSMILSSGKVQKPLWEETASAEPVCHSSCEWMSCSPGTGNCKGLVLLVDRAGPRRWAVQHWLSYLHCSVLEHSISTKLSGVSETSWCINAPDTFNSQTALQLACDPKKQHLEG